MILFVSFLSCIPFAQQQNATNTLPFNFLIPWDILQEVVLNVFGRTLFASSAAYILYTCLVPATHPAHVEPMSRILESPLLTLMGKYSFGVYLTHFIVVVYVTFIFFPPDRMDGLVGSNVFLHFLVALLCSYLLALIPAYIIHHFVEVPCNEKIKEFRYSFTRNQDIDVRMSTEEKGKAAAKKIQ